MTKIISTIILLFFCLNIFGQDSLRSKKILIVATNVNLVGKNTSGTFLMEIIYPFNYFIANGYIVDIITPKGGKVALYDYGDIPSWKKSELFLSKTNNSISPTDSIDKDYIAVFYPGGHGQYFDVLNNERISVLVAKIYENGGVIGTAGHGAASLVNIKLSNGNYLLDGKTMTCFPYWSELQHMFISNYGQLLPFNMEEVLAKRGANIFVCAKEAKQSECAILDDTNRLVTGAYANHAQWVAEEMVKLLRRPTGQADTDK